ncbi:methyl-accepting chemotaxis protein [Pseudoalteromonas sp. MMG010]|uniref:methyl-accepting chemotaxis protein n=1 Tax=Pseudoalteromonas sp. MMG010 TaxID=2822685 RepID=UPI001B3A1BC8|nr:methyl-accepting chemotaxis protein [Pseudoalteromonas sp. MMG010]MBQ4834433.1 methyl-accepting chemotaxis protein [Pseudoalteromonas sp. MMG010]
MAISIGFKQRIMLASTLLVASALLISNWVSYNQTRTGSRSEIEGQAVSTINVVKNDINSWLSANSNVVEKAKVLLRSNNADKKIEIAKMLVATTPLDAINFADEKGLTIGNAGIIEGYNATEETWYQDAQAASQLIMTDIYFDEGISDKYMFSFLDVENGGVIGGDIFLDAVDEFINSINFRGATISLYDANATLISTSGTQKFGASLSQDKALASFEKELLHSRQGEYRYTLDGDAHYIQYSDIVLLGGKKWHLVIDINESIAYDFLAEQLMFSMITAVVLIILTIVLLVYTLAKVYSPIISLKKRVEDLAQGNGDLTQRLDVEGDDDLAQIATAVNSFIDQLQQIMKEILLSSSKVSNEIEHLKEISRSSTQALDCHASETDQAVTAITQMSASANSVAENAKKTAENTQQASNEAILSKQLIQTSTQGVEVLVSEVDAASQCISTMNENTQEIVSVLSIIGAIADQTNLLALNAAIEAARAGEQGRGFAVVADEVRSLAARTQESTAEINDLLAKLTSDSTLAVDAIDSTKNSCKDTTNSTIQVNTSLDTMTNSIIEINELSSHIATASFEQSDVAEEISRNMNSIQSMVTNLTENGALTQASTETLLRENAQMAALVSRFKLQ